MCSISGYGQSGPGAERPAYAPIVQAMTGFEMVTLEAQNELTRPLNMGLPVGDTTAALQAFGGLNAALYYREKCGKGQYVDIAMSDSILATMHRDFQTAFHSDPIERRYGPTKTKDGFIIIMPLSQRHYENLMECIGQSALMKDPRFATTRSRLDNYNELLRLTEIWAENLISTHALKKLENRHVPCAPYRSLAEASIDPQLHFRKMITEVTDEAGPLKVVNSPFSFSETQAAVRQHVAALAEDTLSVLKEELNLSDRQIRTLEEAEIIYCGSKQ
jgi:CoA:oxalate CoA-transferase